MVYHKSTPGLLTPISQITSSWSPGPPADDVQYTKYNVYFPCEVHLSLISIVIMVIKMSGQQEPPPPLFFRFRSSPSFILVTVCLAIFNVSFPCVKYSMTKAYGNNRTYSSLARFVLSLRLIETLLAELGLR